MKDEEKTISVSRFRLHPSAFILAVSGTVLATSIPERAERPKTLQFGNLLVHDLTP